MQIEACKGPEVQSYIDRVAELRLSVFREYPYLYEGNLSEERGYLNMYAASDKSLFIIARDKEKIVGAATGMPLNETSADYWKTFSENGIPIDSIFYLGDIVVLKEYRSQGIGSRIYDLLEKLVNKTGLYKKITFCELIKDPDDLKRPKDYITLESYWKKKGFIKHPELVTHFSWQELGEMTKKRHSLVFSIKNL